MTNRPEPFHEFHCHSSESMPEIADGAVALTVTSPPYWNAIDYDRHAKDDRQNYRTRRYAEGFGDYTSYLGLMERVFSEVKRVTRPGGFCSVVVGTVLNKGSHIPAPFDLLARMCAIGWEFHQDIIWHKCTAGVKRAGVSIQKPFPGYFYPNIMTEYILVFRKPGPRISEGRAKSELNASRYPINGLFTKDLANNVWHIAPVPPGHLEHPCPFPEEIPSRLISLYSFRGDIVLDPFAGSGQTAKVSVGLGRSTIAYDIVQRYVKYAEGRVLEPPAVRPLQLIATFDKIAIDAPLGGAGRKAQTNGHARKQKGVPSSELFAGCG